MNGSNIEVIELKTLVDADGDPIVAAVPASDDYSQVAENLWVGKAPVERLPVEFLTVVNLDGWGKYSIHSAAVYVQTTIPDIAALEMVAMLVALAVGRGPVLVHCTDGKDRACLVAALTLIRDGMEAQEAIEVVRAKRAADAFAAAPAFEHLLMMAAA
jgi:hypothetical protein